MEYGIYRVVDISYIILSVITKPSEIVFALDTSYGVTPEQLNGMRKFVLANLDQYLPSSKLSLVRYGSSAVIDTPLTKDRNLLQTKLASKLEPLSGARNIHKALLKIRDQVFSRDPSMTNNGKSTRQVVLFAAGSSDLLRLNELSNVVKQLKDSYGVSFVYIGLGSEDGSQAKDKELISSGIGSNFNVPRGEFLGSVYDDLFKTLARNAGLASGNSFEYFKAFILRISIYSGKKKHLPLFPMMREDSLET